MNRCMTAPPWLLGIILCTWGLLFLCPVLPSPVHGQGPSPALPTLLEFHRKLCPICKESERIVREVTDRYPGQFQVRRLNIDEAGHLFRQYTIDTVPSLVFLDGAGKEVFRHEGLLPRDRLQQKLRELKFIHD